MADAAHGSKTPERAQDRTAPNSRRKELLENVRTRLEKVDVGSDGKDGASDRTLRKRAFEFISTECLNLPDDTLLRLVKKIEDILNRKDIEKTDLVQASKEALETVRKESELATEWERTVRRNEFKIRGYGERFALVKEQRDEMAGVFNAAFDLAASAFGDMDTKNLHKKHFEAVKSDAKADLANVEKLLSEPALPDDLRTRLQAQKTLLSRITEAQLGDAPVLATLTNTFFNSFKSAGMALSGTAGVAIGAIEGVAEGIKGLAEIGIGLFKLCGNDPQAKEQVSIILEFLKENGLSGLASNAATAFKHEWAEIQKLPTYEQSFAIG
jgi:hypothetical protein